jgi:hypothetical protein
VPAFVPLSAGDEELILLDPVEAAEAPEEARSGRGYFAFYRQMAGGDSPCSPLNNHRCRSTAAFFSPGGTLLWSLPLGDLVDERTSLGIQDVRSDGKTVYFSEKCLRYDGQGQRGGCGGVVAIEATTGRELWRSQSGISAHDFLVVGSYLVSAWPVSSDHSQVLLLRRTDGQLVPSVPPHVPLDHGRFFALPGQKMLLASARDEGAVSVTISQLALDEFSPSPPRLRLVSTRTYEEDTPADCLALPSPLPPAFPFVPGCPEPLAPPAR